MFCTSAAPAEPPTLTRQNSGIGEAYSIITSSTNTNSIIATAQRYDDEPEVNYDDGPTELYKHIEAKDWDKAMARLESHPVEARTWVSRKETTSNKIRWRLLPIHATCIFRAPLCLIEALIDRYQEGLQMKDDQGMLPVHLACRNGGSKGVILALLRGYPNSSKIKDKKGRTPLDLVLHSDSQNAENVAIAVREFVKLDKIVSMTPGGGLGPDAGVVAPTVNEVDYENRTVLFRHLLKKDWKAVVERTRTHPEEAATWIVTKGFNGSLRFLPLHKACVLAPPSEVIDKLMEAYPEGAKCVDQDGWLPIHCACFYGGTSIAIKTLLEAHPKGSQLRDDEGRLPLHYACLKGASQEVVDTLLETYAKGAMSKDDEGRLPIHHACSKGAPKGVIDALLKASPKCAQSKDDQGRLPLHHACRKGMSQGIVRSLISVYPRAAQIKDDQDKLSIHYACQNGSTPGVINTLLTTFPESINVKNGFGYTPIAEAKTLDNSKSEPILNILIKFKKQQDRLKKENGDMPDIEAMNKRMEHLESMLQHVVALGHELKDGVGRVRNSKDLIEHMADRLIALDPSIRPVSFDSESLPSKASRRSHRSRSRGAFRRRNKEEAIF